MKMPKLNFKVLFDNDKFLWFLSFLFAFMLWFTVVNTIDTTADRSITNVPVSFDSSSESLEAMGLDVVLDEPIMVKVDMSGERSVVANVDRQDLLVQADLTGVISAGEYTVHLSVTDRLGRDFDNLSTTPKEVTVRFDRTVKKTLSVTVDLSRLTYPDGYVIGDDYVNVQSVTISGPESDVSKVASCVVRPEKAGGITKTEVLTADLILLDAEGNEVPSDYITMSSDAASVTVPLLKTKRLPITVDFLNVPEDFPLDELRYTLSKEDLLVAGPESSINSMTELSVGYIDFRDLDGGEYNFNLNLPAGFINLEGDESITVSIDTTGIISRTMSVSEIRLENVPDGYPGCDRLRPQRYYGNAHRGGPGGCGGSFGYGSFRRHQQCHCQSLRTGQGSGVVQRNLSGTVQCPGDRLTHPRTTVQQSCRQPAEKPSRGSSFCVKKGRNSRCPFWYPRSVSRFRRAKRQP